MFQRIDVEAWMRSLCRLPQRLQSQTRRQRKHRSESPVRTVEMLELRTLLSGMNVVSVPYVQSTPEVPHPVHEAGQITLKAIVRGVTSGESYQVQWDTDFDGNFDEEELHVYTADAGTLYDIGQAYTVPAVTGNTQISLGVRVREMESGLEQFGSFELYVYDFTPSPDPRNWTDAQLNVIQSMTVSESLWYAHRHMTRTGEGTSEIRGAYDYTVGTANALQLLVQNGHSPAYPVGTFDAHSLTLPTGWQAANDTRWETDPYAETALRFLNEIANGAVLTTIASGNEGNTAGYSAGGTAITANRITGTTDLQGIIITDRGSTFEGGAVQAQGASLAAVAAVLPALGGTPVQIGTAAGQRWEWFVQQAVDYLGHAQIKSGTGRGSWFFSPTASGTTETSHADSFIGAVHGLAEAERWGAMYGVVVDNLHKYSIVEPLLFHQRGDGSIAWRGSSTVAPNGQLNFTGGFLEAARWLGIQNFAMDNVVPFAGQSTKTRVQLRTAYNSMLAYVASNFTRSTASTNPWFFERFWVSGDYLQGNTNAVYGAGTAGEPYNMLLHARAYRQGTPDLSVVGAHNWNRQFATYLSRAQQRSGDYDTFGRVQTTISGVTSHSGSNGNQHWGTLLAGLTLTSETGVWLPEYAGFSIPAEDIFKNESVTLEANPYDIDLGNVIAYQWDYNASNGLWWVTSGTPDATGETATTSFATAGARTVTLRILKGDGTAQTFTRELTVLNAPPMEITLSQTSSPENVALGSSVATLSSVAPDWPGGATFVYTLVDGEGSTDNANFTIVGTQLQTAAALNFETQTSHQIRLRTTDSNGNFFEQAFSISVTDVNEFVVSTVLDSHAAPNTIPENVAAGTPVGITATAFDADGTNNTVTYSLLDNAGGRFVIDAVTGVVTVADAGLLDYEAAASHTITVQAQSSDTSTSTQGFTIQITNVNEDPTDLTLSNASVPEGPGPTTVIGTLLGIDPDLGETFTYALVTGDGDADNDKFFLDGAQLVFSGALDFETQSSYSVRVRVTDANGLTFDKPFTISVTNVNEAPTLLSLTGTAVEENEAAGTVVGTLAALDPDVAETFTFTLEAGTGDTGNEFFEIVGNELRLATPLDFETQSSYSVRVRVTDAAGAALDQVFLIDVLNVNELPTVQLDSAALAARRKKATAIDAAALLIDDDSPSFAGGSLTIAITQGAQANDALGLLKGSFDGVKWKLAKKGTEFRLGKQVLARVTQAANGTQLTFQFEVGATRELVQAVLRNITLKGKLAGDRVLTVTVTDPGALSSEPVSRTVEVR